MAQNINQFAQAPVDGQLDLSFIGPIVSARVSNSQAVALIAGQAVKGDNAAPGTSFDGPPPLLSLGSNGEPCIGFVVRNVKDASYPANARLELAMDGACMYKTANGAITRFNPVEYDIATNKIGPWGGINQICGYAYDAAINNGDLIRIITRSPQLTSANTSGAVKTVTVSSTLAEINAGKVLLPAVAGKKITIVDYTARVTGAFATGTSVIIESTNGTPVLVSTIAEAGLTNGAILKPTSANTTLGAGFSVPLGSGDGLQVVNSGAAQTGGTKIDWTFLYTQA